MNFSCSLKDEDSKLLEENVRMPIEDISKTWHETLKND